MADDAELIGGISVSVGASHSKLISDLAEADRIIEAWAKQPRNATVGASFAGATGGAGAAGAPSGDLAALSGKLDRLTAALGRGSAGEIRRQRVEAESVSIRGAGGAQSFGSISDLMKLEGPQAASIKAQLEQAIGPVEVPVDIRSDQLGQATTQVHDLQVSSKQPIILNLDADAAKNDLQAILALLKQVAATAVEAGEAGAIGGGAGGGGTRRTRRKNIRDQGIGTEANASRIYTFDPEVYAEQEARQEAAAARQRELAAQGHADRRRTQQAAQDRAVVAETQRNGQRDQAAAARANAQQAAQPQFGPMYVTDIPGSTSVAPLRTANTPADTRPRGVGAPITDTERAARDARTRAQAERANAPSQRFDPSSTPTAAERENIAQGRRAETRRQSFEERQQRALNTRQFQEAEIVRRQEQAQATQQAAITAAGRTARTTASGFGAFFGGPRREQIEAQTSLSAAVKETASATRYAAVFENEMIRNETKARGATVGEAQALRDRNKEIKGSDQYKQAVQDRTEAIEKEGAATERVAKLSQGFGTAAKSLLSVTVAGAAFGVGLQAVGIAFSAAEKAAAPYIDAITGYAQKTNDFTSALADQARQQQGNVQGVTALKLAQSGFAQSSAASIQPIIAQRAQVEAGNKALQEQIDTFRVAETLRKQANTAGLGGGTGGVLGTSIFGIPGTGEQAGNFLQGLGADVGARQAAIQNRQSAPFSDFGDPIGEFLGLAKKRAPGEAQANDQKALVQSQQAFGRGLALINDQLKQGGDGAAKFQQALNGTDSRIGQTAAAFDTLSPEMAKAIRDNNLYSDAIAGSSDAIGGAIAALRALDIAGTKVGPAEQLAAEQIRQTNARNSLQALQSQQAFERPGFLAGVVRQQGLSANVQLPAQEALANLANPPTPVGTGRVAANAAEQRQINRETKSTQTLQDDLNKNYERGRQIIEDTYKPAIIQNFGIAAGATFDSLIQDITTTGQAIARVQASISNEQAAYATAQYNYQLFIAKRTLSDIGGLTDHNFGAGKSYLGVLEGQNLALSRQAQLLQFGLSQRQINLQRAIAGFTVPGLTPAEQNARVAEAKIEADFAQKQLNIQKEMFRNQVKIVDISNLRQGADLVKQIALLQQGRQVTIDTQAAQEKLERLNKRQQHLIAQAGTYITAIDQIVAKAQSDMAAQEAILGRALGRFESQAVATMYNVGAAFFAGLTGGILGSTPNQNKTSSNVAARDEKAHRHASGGIFSTQGLTALGPNDVAGEAGNETVAILRHPRALLGTGADGGDITINFNGDNVFKTEADFQKMYRMVVTALGRDAATKGLRTPF